MNRSSITHIVYIGACLLNAPLWSMYQLLIFIFCRDLQATPWEVTLLLSSKPLCALFSFYGSAMIEKRPCRLKTYLAWTTFLGFLPSFFFPWIENRYLFILASAFYMLFVRAVIPAWMEIIKLQIAPEERSDTLAKGSAANYMVGIFLPLLISGWMDQQPLIWRYLFPLFSLIGLLSLALIAYLPSPPQLKAATAPVSESSSQPTSQPTSQPLSQLMNWRHKFVQPWKNCYHLLRQRPDFASFQLIYMFGGLGLMVILAAMPAFTMNILQLSYKEVASAIATCKGIGFTCSTKLWATAINKLNLYFFSCLVTILAGLFPLIAILAIKNHALMYVAYLVYGVMQGGSELGWNLSGPIFAKDQDSSSFTGVNVVLVGIRGCIGPFIGGMLCAHNPVIALALGALLCFSGALWAFYCSHKELVFNCR